MLQVLPAFPDQPQHTYTIQLDGATYRVRLTWRARQRSWYIDLYDADDAALALGRRLSPGFAPLVRVAEGMPLGLAYTYGKDGYIRLDLGNEVQLFYLPADDIVPRAAPDALVVEIVP